MRNWRPFIADAIDALAGAGVKTIIGLPLAPQFSTLSVQKYIDAATSALPNGIAFSCVRTYHNHPLLIEAFAERVREAAPTAGEAVIFTAHSLPERVARAGDPYPEEVATTARLVAARAGLASYHVAYQSAGRTPEPWLGPDVSEVIRQLAATGGRSFLIVPIGFVCDHTEVLYDIDVQAASAASECGATLRRTTSLNTSPTFIRALAALVRTALEPHA
jgi:ferrochelatase